MAPPRAVPTEYGRDPGGETVPDDQIGVVVESGEELPHRGGFVLAVGVELDGPFIPVIARVPESGAQRTADAEVEGQA